MKNMLMKATCLMGGVGVLGFMYMKKHPEIINKGRNAIKEASRKMYIMMDE